MTWSELNRWQGSGAAWDRHADRLAPLADKLNQPLLDAVGLRPGEQLLDLAAGAGEPALSAAATAGLVVALDFAPSMMAGLVRRAAGLAHPPLALAGDMTALPFGPAAFDRVTCRFGLMFVPDDLGALSEARRVLRPGGKAGFMVWGPMAENRLMAEINRAARALLPAEAVAAHDRLFRHAAPGLLAARMAEAGFADATERALTPIRRAPLADAPWRPAMEMSFGDLLGDRRDSMDRMLSARMEGMADADGMIELPVHVRIGLATA